MQLRVSRSFGSQGWLARLDQRGSGDWPADPAGLTLPHRRLYGCPGEEMQRKVISMCVDFLAL